MKSDYADKIDSYLASRDPGATIAKSACPAHGVRLSVDDESGAEVARGYLYIMFNDLHDEPFGFMEDIYVVESARSMGYGTKLVTDIVETARELGCYKLIGTSRHDRPRVHELYKRLGFENRGVEFRMELK